MISQFCSMHTHALSANLARLVKASTRQLSLIPFSTICFRCTNPWWMSCGLILFLSSYWQAIGVCGTKLKVTALFTMGLGFGSRSGSLRGLAHDVLSWLIELEVASSCSAFLMARSKRMSN